MNTTTNQIKRKWQAPTDPTKFELYYPPARAPRKTTQWDNWVAAMMMDMRLSSTDRAILTRLALHYNLRTGDCFPSRARIALEVGLSATDTDISAVKRAVSKGVRLGWIKRTLRTGGPREKNQTNLYDLTLPAPVCGVLATVGYQPSGPKPPDHKYQTTYISLSAVKRDDGWRVIQLADGMTICGPFRTEGGANEWIRDHGPPTRPTWARHRGDISGVPRGHFGDTEGTIAPPITGKYQNREVIEHSVTEVTAPIRLAAGSAHSRAISDSGRKGSAEEVSAMVESDVEDFLINFCDRPRSFGAIRAFCQARNSDITFNELTALVRAGKVKQSRDGYWMDEDEE
jgi:hypothetical protein